MYMRSIDEQLSELDNVIKVQYYSIDGSLECTVNSVPTSLLH